MDAEAGLVVEMLLGRLGLGHGAREALKPLHGSLNVCQKLFGHVPAESCPNHKPQYRHLIAIGRHGVSGNQPAPLAQLVGELEDRPIGDGLIKLHGKHRQLAHGVADQPELGHRGDAIGQAAGDGFEGRHTVGIAGSAEVEEVEVHSTASEVPPQKGVAGDEHSSTSARW